MVKINKQTGFTLIELIVVIVVIAILAAIAVVGYSGIQNRAYNTKIIAAVRAWDDAMRLYSVQNGSVYQWSGFPAAGVSAGAFWCLGDTASYPAISGVFASGACDSVSTVNNAFTTTLQKQSGMTVGSSLYDKYVTYTANASPTVYNSRGLSYNYAIDSSHTNIASKIFYYLQGNDTNCKIAGAERSPGINGATQCSLDVSQYFTLGP